MPAPSPTRAEVAGYDLSPEMVAFFFARERLRPVGGRVWVGEMSGFGAAGPLRRGDQPGQLDRYLRRGRDRGAPRADGRRASAPAGSTSCSSPTAASPRAGPARPLVPSCRRHRNDTALGGRARTRRRAAPTSTAASRRRRGRAAGVRRGPRPALLDPRGRDAPARRLAARLDAVYWDNFEEFPLEDYRMGEHGNLYHVLRREKPRWPRRSPRWPRPASRAAPSGLGAPGVQDAPADRRPGGLEAQPPARARPGFPGGPGASRSRPRGQGLELPEVGTQILVPRVAEIGAQQRRIHPMRAGDQAVAVGVAARHRLEHRAGGRRG